jgi:cytochrome c oxidase subunit 2
VLGACALLFVVAPFAGWWLPFDASSYGSKVDGLFYLILIITGVTYIGVEAVLVWALWKFAARPGAKSSYQHGHHRLEMIWTAVPAAILLFIAFAQVSAWADIKYQSRMPDPNLVFEVSARQFEWRFRYPTAETLDTLTKNWKTAGQKNAAAWEKTPNIDDVRVVNEVHIWKHTEQEPCRVRMFLKTKDVLHSFFLPNLRIKQDALPGKTIPVFFDSTESNVKWDDEKKELLSSGKDKEWELACAELCGWGHYKMRGRLYVHESKEDYKKWLDWELKKQNARNRD